MTTLKELRALHEAAEPEPWVEVPVDDGFGMPEISNADEAFIVAMRNALPLLLDVVEAAQYALQRSAHLYMLDKEALEAEREYIERNKPNLLSIYGMDNEFRNDANEKSGLALLPLSKALAALEADGMVAPSAIRGHLMHFDEAQQLWLYTDTNTPVSADERDCGGCGQPNTPEGHDACLGTLPNVRAACCGHGATDGTWGPYVCFEDGSRLDGAAALAYFQDVLEADHE